MEVPVHTPPAATPPKVRGRPFPKRKQVGVVEKPATFDATVPWRKFQTFYISDPCRLTFLVRAAQIGLSTASAAWTVGECIARDNHRVIVLSCLQTDNAQDGKVEQR